MPYVTEICSALATVLNQAADGPPERFTGYLVNREFWVAETVHCLEVIAGYWQRFERMKRASESSDPRKVDWPTIPIAKPSMNSGDLSDARRMVREAARRFLRRCVKVAPEDQAEIYEDARRLGLPTPL